MWINCGDFKRLTVLNFRYKMVLCSKPKQKKEKEHTVFWQEKEQNGVEEFC